MSKLKELIRLHKEQVSNRKIGRMLGMDKKTVGKYVKLVDKDPLGPDGLLKLSDTDLLIVDDFGLVKLSGQQLIDFMEIIEDRHARKSTIIASQLPIAEWYDVLAKNKTIADSIIGNYSAPLTRKCQKSALIISKLVLGLFPNSC